MRSIKVDDLVDDGSESPDQSDTQSTKNSRHRSHVTRACIRCRLSKIKCEGTQPCGNCVVRKKDCAYSQTKDGRRSRLHMKRRLDDVERENAIFHHVFDSMRSATDAQLIRIVEFVRSQASLVEIELWLCRMFDGASLDRQRCDGVDADIGVHNDVVQKESATKDSSLDHIDTVRADSTSQDICLDTSRYALDDERYTDRET